MIAAMAPLGMDVAPAPSPVTAASPIDELIEYFVTAEDGFAMLGDVFFATPPRPPA